jgi:hypothetical protein
MIKSVSAGKTISSPILDKDAAGLDGTLNKRAKLSCDRGVVPLLALGPLYPTYNFYTGRDRRGRKFKKCNIFTQPDYNASAFS